MVTCACHGVSSLQPRNVRNRASPPTAYPLQGPNTLPAFGFVVQDLPAQVYESGAKTAEIDYRNSPLEAARGQRVGVVVGASSGRHGKGRFVIATGVLGGRSSYMVSRDEWQASASQHCAKACGRYSYRARAKLWRLHGVRVLRKPVPVKIIKGTRRWTALERL